MLALLSKTYTKYRNMARDTITEKGFNEAVARCVKQTFGLMASSRSPVISNKEVPCIIMLSDGVLYAIRQDTARKNIPVTICVGTITVLTEKCNHHHYYLATLKYHDTTRDVVLCYANDFDHFRYGCIVDTIRDKMIKALKNNYGWTSLSVN